MEYCFCFMFICVGVSLIIAAQQTKIGIMPEINKTNYELQQFEKETNKNIELLDRYTKLRIDKYNELIQTMFSSIDKIYQPKGVKWSSSY